MNALAAALGRLFRNLAPPSDDDMAAASFR